MSLLERSLFGVTTRLAAELDATRARLREVEGELDRLVTERAELLAVHGAAVAALSWVVQRGSLGNHGHRTPGTSCAECRVVNALAAALRGEP